MDAIRAVLRSTRLLPLLCGGALSVVVLSIPILAGTRFDFIDATLSLHLSMLIVLVGAAFVLDDPARPLTEVMPISATRTTVLRMALSLIPITVFWSILLALAPYTVSNSRDYDRWGLIIELYALLTWVWAVAAAVAARRDGGMASPLAAPFVLFAGVVLVLLPDSAALFVSPGAEHFGPSRWRWLAVGVVGAGALWVAVSGRISAFQRSLFRV